jgi:nitrite reductase/ring-hydroxylating ferredoxin subunit
MATATSMLRRAAVLEDVRRLGSLVAHVDGHTLALFADGDGVHAVDNRCPHMGFPLHRGTLSGGILTCHWHHARFDVATGGTFDQWADELRVFPVEVRDGEVWVDLAPLGDPLALRRARLGDGLERNLPLVIAKSVIGLVEGGADPVEPFRAGLEFGSRYRAPGFGQGLTMHACFANLLPVLDPDDRAHALHQGLSALALDCAGMAPRFAVRPLPGAEKDVEVLTRWFRQFVEVRDAEGAERCIASAVRAGADDPQLGRMLFAAATDHRYIRTGHVLDFTNKALESLDVVGWDRELAERVLASLATEYAFADRMEESNAWRHPVDVVAIVERAFERLPPALPAMSRSQRHSLRPGPVRTRRCCSERIRRRSRTIWSTRSSRGLPSRRSRPPWSGRPPCGSRGSTRRTSSPTGTRRCTPSRSRTRCTRGSGARLRASSSAASSTPR